MNHSFRDEDFKTPSFSGGHYQVHGHCVSVAVTTEAVGVRDTKDGAKTTLTFTHDEWDAFVKGVKAGEYDLPG